MNRPEFLTIDETAELLRIKKQTLFKWIMEKRIPSYAVGGRTLFRFSELAEWIEDRKRNAFETTKTSNRKREMQKGGTYV